MGKRGKKKAANVTEDRLEKRTDRENH